MRYYAYTQDNKLTTLLIPSKLEYGAALKVALQLEPNLKPILYTEEELQAKLSHDAWLDEQVALQEQEDAQNIPDEEECKRLWHQSDASAEEEMETLRPFIKAMMTQNFTVKRSNPNLWLLQAMEYTPRKRKKDARQAGAV